MTNPISLVPPHKPRISAKLRHAIELYVCEGKTITEACAEAGMSRQGFHKAMKRPAVRDLLEPVAVLTGHEAFLSVTQGRTR